MALAGYYSLGNQADANIVISLSPGPTRITIEIMLVLHLVSAFPILINPPLQYFEQLFKIPSGKMLSLWISNYYIFTHAAY